MAIVFANNRGTVYRVPTQRGGALPFEIRMEGVDVGGAANQGTRAIITQAAIVEQGNYQFLHTLADTVYVYVFGNKIGDLQVSGLAFASGCVAGQESGMDQILRNYRAHCIANKAAPVKVSFGTQYPFRSFLTGMTMTIADPETMMAQWTYRFNSFPGK